MSIMIPLKSTSMVMG